MKLGERLYTPEEASEALSGMYAPSTLRNMATRGEIAHIGGINGKTRQKIRFTATHLQEFLETLEQPATRLPGTRAAQPITAANLKTKLKTHY